MTGPGALTNVAGNQHVQNFLKNFLDFVDIDALSTFPPLERRFWQATLSAYSDRNMRKLLNLERFLIDGFSPCDRKAL